MPPSIRVTQDVYDAIRKMINADYAKTTNGVMENLLREKGVIPSNVSSNQNITFQLGGKNRIRPEGPSSFTEKEESEFRGIFGENIPNYRFQRDAMRDVYKRFNGKKDKSIRAYAWLEENGYTLRKNNAYNFSSLYYSEALFNDGVKKGWLSVLK